MTKKKLDLQEFLNNYFITEKYYLYFQQLNSLSCKNPMKHYPFLFDFRRSFKFLTAITLCNFLRKGSDIYLDKLILSVNDEKKRKELENLFNSLKNDEHFNNLFNLRDKYISHRDKDWHKHDMDFPDDVLKFYLNLIKMIIEEAFKFQPIIFESRNYEKENESFLQFFEHLNKSSES